MDVSEHLTARGRARTGMVLWMASIVLVAALVALLVYSSGSHRSPARMHGAGVPAADQERFVAVFDSLYQVRLRPLVWKAATFTAMEFDDARHQWTLTITPSDWNRRNMESKKDLAATLHTALQAVLAQAGGNPQAGVVIIQDENGDRLAKSSDESGTLVYR
jgi:hypothetical protein